MEFLKIRSFRDLTMWQSVKDFAVSIYRITEQFPRDEVYGLTSQLRRASVSIVSSIAEGFERRHPREKIQFLRIACGSGAEVETQLTIAHELRYIGKDEYNKLIGLLREIMKMMNAVLRKL